MPEPEVRDHDRRRNDRPFADVAEDERQRSGQDGGSDDGPRQRRGRINWENLVEVRGVEEQDRVRSEQERVQRGSPQERTWDDPPTITVCSGLVTQIGNRRIIGRPSQAGLVREGA